MSHTEYTRIALDAASQALGEDEPVYMVNLVRYRAEADYGASSGLPACSGREAYFQRYAPAFKQVASSEDYAVFWVGNVRGVLVGTDSEAWDDVVIVRYSSFMGLRRILESPAYERDAAPHRRAALADWKFIITTQPDLPK
ncbi:DUF1330 domain-containing protein [Burkholderia cenocepacia]|uniref:hypothetical protein n=1 Tax=Burkholderia cenocepacia TaxID=95486 RepID=UPI00190359C9|nr:hypothetical protein [Burkholderia cenocepacia]MBJ9698483.1 hypothetical protein [Burkholderia cenocepacia]MCA8251508.1 hypothetical protein [Burkholderia multivorans]